MKDILEIKKIAKDSYSISGTGSELVWINAFCQGFISCEILKSDERSAKLETELKYLGEMINNLKK